MDKQEPNWAKAFNNVAAPLSTLVVTALWSVSASAAGDTTAAAIAAAGAAASTMWACTRFAKGLETPAETPAKQNQNPPSQQP